MKENKYYITTTYQGWFSSLSIKCGSIKNDDSWDKFIWFDNKEDAERFLHLMKNYIKEKYKGDSKFTSNW